jgi:multiple sugar transport system permease protein
MVEIKQSDVGQSASMSVFNFALVTVIVIVYLSTTRWKEQVDQ